MSSLFDIYDIRVAQILLTADDFRNRQRYLNARDTMLGLLSARVVPIINENDTVATEEIKVGDNDNLGALVVTLIEADLLILLSHIDGLYTADPRLDPDARLIDEVAARRRDDLGRRRRHRSLRRGPAACAPRSRPRSWSSARARRRSSPTAANRTCCRACWPGSGWDALSCPSARASADASRMATCRTLESRKRWILAGSQARGGIVRRPRGRGRPSPATAKACCRSAWSRSARALSGARRCASYDGETEIARGVVRYSSDELDQIKGLHSKQIREQLGYDYGDEVVHHNDMVIL